ncbi:MAG: glycosyltransferase [Chlorobiaceae bacterium]|nr:glycosyltransferase [Chlorobiaceae bacterium]
MSDKSERLLIIFSKNPVAGQVKTRLASSIGDTEALQVYETLREITGKVAARADAMLAVFYSDFIPETDTLLTGIAEAHLQEGNDLGERMHRAFLKGFALGFRHIVLIGTDCPELSTFLIDRAFQSLSEEEVVMGPARDGGFYLVGLNRPFPELFLGRTWSTSSVLHESLGIIRASNASCSLLPALSDIDTIDDLINSGLWDNRN